MLEGIDQVPWSALQHAYGPATDVPEMIRALQSTIDDPWESGEDHPFRQLANAINHQGSLYSSTPATVPFLLELAADPLTPLRLDILSLLGAIASNDRDGECELAVAKGLDIYRPLLADQNARCRSVAAYVLSSIPCVGDQALIDLRQATSTEGEELTCAGMYLCLGRFGSSDSATTSLLREHLKRTRKRVLRAAAAVALAMLLKADAPAEAKKALCKLIDAEWFHECFHGLPWDVYADFELYDLIEDLGPVVSSQAVAGRLKALATADESEAGFIVQDLLRLGFKPVSHSPLRPPVPFELSGDQLAILRELVKSNVAWRAKNLFLFFLHEVGFPMRRWELAERIGEPSLCPRPSLLNERNQPRLLLDNANLHEGDRVFQVDMGVGTVQAFQGSDTVSIDFDCEGPARFVRSVVKLYSAH